MRAKGGATRAGLIGRKGGESAACAKITAPLDGCESRAARNAWLSARGRQSAHPEWLVDKALSNLDELG